MSTLSEPLASCLVTISIDKNDLCTFTDVSNNILFAKGHKTEYYNEAGNTYDGDEVNIFANVVLRTKTRDSDNFMEF